MHRNSSLDKTLLHLSVPIREQYGTSDERQKSSVTRITLKPCHTDHKVQCCILHLLLAPQHEVPLLLVPPSRGGREVSVSQPCPAAGNPRAVGRRSSPESRAVPLRPGENQPGGLILPDACRASTKSTFNKRLTPRRDTGETPPKRHSSFSSFSPQTNTGKTPFLCRATPFPSFPPPAPSAGPAAPSPAHSPQRTAPCRAAPSVSRSRSPLAEVRCGTGGPAQPVRSGFSFSLFFFFLLPLVQGSPASPRSLAVLPQATVCSLSSPPVPRWFCAEGTADGKEMLSFCFSDVL